MWCRRADSTSDPLYIIDLSGLASEIRSVVHFVHILGGVSKRSVGVGKDAGFGQKLKQYRKQLRAPHLQLTKKKVVRCISKVDCMLVWVCMEEKAE